MSILKSNQLHHTLYNTSMIFNVKLFSNSIIFLMLSHCFSLQFLLSADEALKPGRKVAFVENERSLGLGEPFEGQLPQFALGVLRLHMLHLHTILNTITEERI